MASIKNTEVSDILQQWLEKRDISIAEAARQLDITSPVLWRQLNTKDSIPLTRIIEFVHRWAPSNEDIEKLEDLLNDISIPDSKSQPFDFERCIGRLEAVSSMLKNAILNNVPDEVKDSVRTMTDLLDATIDEMNMKKARRTPQGKKQITLPRKTEIHVQIERLEKEISMLKAKRRQCISPEFLDYVSQPQSESHFETEFRHDPKTSDNYSEPPEEKAKRQATLREIESEIKQKEHEIAELRKKI